MHLKYFHSYSSAARSSRLFISVKPSPAVTSSVHHRLLTLMKACDCAAHAVAMKEPEGRLCECWEFMFEGTGRAKYVARFATRLLQRYVSQKKADSPFLLMA